MLISGKWQLPKVRHGSFVGELLRSEKVGAWFSHNSNVDHPKRRPFPYGVCHLTASDVLDEAGAPAPDRKDGIYFGYVGVHEHLTPEAREARLSFKERMDSMRPLPEYLRRMHSYRFVASPQGDRPETYRHWEAIALGSVPISDAPRQSFEPLFGASMIYLERMRDILELDPASLDSVQPNPTLAGCAYWAERLEQVASRLRADRVVDSGDFRNREARCDDSID